MARGHIHKRENGAFRVLVYAGRDPLTGKERRVTGTAPTLKDAERLRTKLLGDLDQGRKAGKKVTVAEVIQAWLDTSEHELTTRRNYERYTTRIILPALGQAQARKVDVETLDRFYAELRKRGGKDGQGLAGNTVRKVHFILRASFGLAVKWGWIPDNPAERATVPRFVRQEVHPPTPSDSQRFLDAAWEHDPDFGTLIWVAMMTGARRGELCALRWSHVRLQEERLLITRNLVHVGREREEKDTKTHQARFLALDEITIQILTEHRARCEDRAAACAVTLRPDGYVFSTSPDGAEPCLPDSVSRRVGRLATRLDIVVTLRSLRHYAATEMLTSGVDLRTVAGRLGHGEGGATTLRVYTHFIPAPDRHAAQTLARTVKRPTGLPQDSGTP
ncbi:MAG: tyrosine-type recombinase/integrase [Egibacteraceae bacterium]